jgi:DNA-binding LytR/AlgR family response regulator
MALEINLVRGWLPGAPARSGLAPFFWLLGGMLAFCLYGQLLVRFVAARATDPPHDGTGEIRFLKRIPKGIAGDLLSLRTEDHYLRIHTTAGSDLILFRLKDALAELGPADGLQVHRSYWVARDAIEAIERQGRKTILVLKNGQHVPVSASFLPAVRDAGWLER